MIEELAIVTQAIKLMRQSADELEKNPFALDDVMAKIDNWWGVTTGRLEKSDLED